MTLPPTSVTVALFGSLGSAFDCILRSWNLTLICWNFSLASASWFLVSFWLGLTAFLYASQLFACQALKKFWTAPCGVLPPQPAIASSAGTANSSATATATALVAVRRPFRVFISTSTPQGCGIRLRDDANSIAIKRRARLGPSFSGSALRLLLLGRLVRGRDRHVDVPSALVLRSAQCRCHAVLLLDLGDRGRLYLAGLGVLPFHHTGREFDRGLVGVLGVGRGLELEPEVLVIVGHELLLLVDEVGVRRAPDVGWQDRREISVPVPVLNGGVEVPHRRLRCLRAT